VVDARVNTSYHYQATARDEDGDPHLRPRLRAGRNGRRRERTGNVTPTAAQAGPHNVSLTVSDGRGGTATQTFTVVVGSEPGNLPPVIFSDPVTQIGLVDTSGNPIQLDLAAGQSATQPVTFTLPDGLVPAPTPTSPSWWTSRCR
jgi:hypothetical protein